MIRVYLAQIYQKILNLARRPAALWYLAALSALESFILPITPVVLLLPMILAKRESAWRYANVTSAASVVGGVIGFYIGVYFLQYIYPLVIHIGYQDDFHQSVEWLRENGFWFMFLASLSPLPFKLFTIGAGVVGMSVYKMLLASLLGRYLHFYILTAILVLGGDAFTGKLERYGRWLAAIIIVIFLGVYAIMHADIHFS